MERSDQTKNAPGKDNKRRSSPCHLKPWEDANGQPLPDEELKAISANWSPEQWEEYLISLEGSLKEKLGKKWDTKDTLLVRVALLNQWDEPVIHANDILEWMWRKPQLWTLYYYAMVSFPALAWGSTRVMRKRWYREEMDSVFQASGVTNRIGQAPKPVTSFETNDGTKVLRVSAKGISVDDFKRSKGALEQSLRGHVEGFVPNIAKGTIDIRYSQNPTPSEYCIGHDDITPFESENSSSVSAAADSCGLGSTMTCHTYLSPARREAGSRLSCGSCSRGCTSTIAKCSSC